MNITISNQDGENLVNVTVDADNFVRQAIDACWVYLSRYGSGSATAREPSGARICTVGIEIHDE